MTDQMEYDIDFSQMPDYALITTRGMAEVEGFASLLKDLTESPHWQKGTKQLIDHRDLDLSHFGPADICAIQNIVKLFANRLGSGRCAFVMEGISGFLTGQFYVSSVNSSRKDNRAFSEMTPALFWLLIDE